MNLNDFSIVLPSNSSKKYFPNNTTTNYSTRLPREVELYGKWFVGISEIHIPCTTLHLRREDTLLTGDRAESQDLHFQYGTFDSIHSLVGAINDALPLYNTKKDVCQKLFYNEKGGFVSIGFLSRNGSVRMCNSPILTEPVKRILGFEEGIIPAIDKHTIGEYALRYVGSQPASLARGIPDQLFVYSNLCEPSIVGDTHAPLLRIVNLEAKQFNFGSTIVKKFSPVNYIPLLNNRFQTVDIDIRDQFGKPIPFEFGTLTVTLHFKKEF